MSDNDAIEKKIEELEAEMARTQKNKATNYHLVRRFLLRVYRLGKSTKVLVSHKQIIVIYSPFISLALSLTTQSGDIESENS
jgi:septal ring factor EnvC (AmiA/AmiB activator)